MKIYLDIDGTLIDKRTFKPAPHLKKFLKYMTENHDVYWLTTHCQGDPTQTLNYIRPNVSEDIFELMKKMKPTKWDTLKIKAINISEDFLWFDDYAMQVEQKILKENNKLNSWIKVDLNTNPNIFLEFIESSAMKCNAYVIEIFGKSFMLHIWTKPKLSFTCHTKKDWPKKRLFWVSRFN